MGKGGAMNPEAKGLLEAWLIMTAVGFLLFELLPRLWEKWS